MYLDVSAISTKEWKAIYRKAGYKASTLTVEFLHESAYSKVC